MALELNDLDFRIFKFKASKLMALELENLNLPNFNLKGPKLNIRDQKLIPWVEKATPRSPQLTL